MASATSQALHRSSRALVARALIDMHERDELEDPEQWSWQRLDSMPVWCLLQPGDRQQLQRMCGLLVKAPAVACWLDGRSIRTVHALLGKDAVEQVLEQALKLGAGNEEMQADASEVPISPSPESVDMYLLTAGGSVLRSSLDASLPLARLATSLEDDGVDIAQAVAHVILNRAHSLLPDLCDTLFQKMPVHKNANQNLDAMQSSEPDLA